MPRLSIITINYNDSTGLKKTIESVLTQKDASFEYIVIDGGSTDGSVDVIKENAGRITCWSSEKDSGIYNAMNKGIAKATGEYCLFLNSGDSLVNDNVISKVFSMNCNEDILYGELIFDRGDKQEQIAARPDKLDAKHMFHDNIWHPASFIRRSLFTSIGMYNEKYKIAADYDFFFNALISKKVSSKYLNFPIAVHDASGVSSSPENAAKVNAEREAIHRSYLGESEITYLQNLKKFRNENFSKWLVNKPGMNKMFDSMLNMYSKWRN